MTRLAEVGDLGQEALRLLEGALTNGPPSDVEVIQQFAAIARVREIARQLEWPELTDLEELYAYLATSVRGVLDKEGY